MYKIYKGILWDKDAFRGVITGNIKAFFENTPGFSFVFSEWQVSYPPIIKLIQEVWSDKFWAQLFEYGWTKIKVQGIRQALKEYAKDRKDFIDKWAFDTYKEFLQSNDMQIIKGAKVKEIYSIYNNADVWLASGDMWEMRKLVEHKMANWTKSENDSDAEYEQEKTIDVLKELAAIDALRYANPDMKDKINKFYVALTEKQQESISNEMWKLDNDLSGRQFYIKYSMFDMTEEEAKAFLKKQIENNIIKPEIASKVMWTFNKAKNDLVSVLIEQDL